MKQEYPHAVDDPKSKTGQVIVHNEKEHKEKYPEDYAQMVADRPGPVEEKLVQAVLRERERCANIARNWPGTKGKGAEIAKFLLENAPEIEEIPVAEAPISEPASIEG